MRDEQQSPHVPPEQPRAVALAPLEIHAGMRVGDVALLVCSQHLAAIVFYEPLVRADDDPEAVHQMRVAIRRLDAVVRLFGDVLPAWAQRSRTTLRGMIQTLGARRDLDLQLAHLREFGAGLAPDERESLAVLETRLETERRRAHKRMIRFLDSARVTSCVARWKAFMRATPEMRKSAGAELVQTFADEAIRKRHKRLRRLAGQLVPESSAAQHHEVRSRVKRLRYAIEAFAPLYGPVVPKFLRALIRLQDVLGVFQDADVRSARLVEMAHGRNHRLPAETVFVLGRIVERDARIARAARRRVPKAARRVEGRRWKTLRAAMAELAHAKPRATRADRRRVTTRIRHVTA